MAALVASAAVVCVVAWLTVNVVCNYDGSLTGLYCTGAHASLPPELDGSHTYRIHGSAGYDGQFYHLIAHDPLLQRGFLVHVDNPRLRWRRIGVPALAALAAGGDDRYVDRCYVAVQLAFVFLGVFWLSLFAQLRARHPAWGLAFLLVPAVAVSLDRMTVDLALAALSVGLVYCVAARNSARTDWRLYSILCAVPLVRETGMMLVVAWCLYSALRKEWREAALGAACAVPALAWWGFVASRTPSDGTPWLSTYPFSGIIEETLYGASATGSTLWMKAASWFEAFALGGIWLALALCGYLAWKRRAGLLEVTAVVFALFAGTLGKADIWSSAYAAGRTLSPLLIVLALLALERRSRAFALPLLLVLPRIVLQYEAQLRLALRSFNGA
jgi:hypothetical protein